MRPFGEGGGMGWIYVCATRPKGMLNFICWGRKVVRASARMPTHTVILHEWGMRCCGLVLCMATRKGFFHGLTLLLGLLARMDQELLFATELKIDARRIFEVVLVSGIGGSVNSKAG
jgi:hypothetical protein